MALLPALPSLAAPEFNVTGQANVRMRQQERIGLAGPPTSAERSVIQDNWTMHSNASWVGLRGSEALGRGLEVFFRVDYQVEIDDGEAGAAGDPFRERDVYVGLGGRWGKLFMGRRDTLFKSVGIKMQVFAERDSGAFISGDDRRSNMVVYQSPPWRGLYFGAALSPGEATRDAGAAAAADSAAGYTALSVEYERPDRFALGLAVNRSMPSVFAPDSGALSGARLVARWLGPQWIRLGLLAQALESDSAARRFTERGGLLSAACQTGGWQFKLQFGKSEREQPGTRVEHGYRAFGAEYRLSDAAMLYGYYFSMLDKTVAPAVDAGRDSDRRLDFGFELQF